MEKSTYPFRYILS